MGKMYNRLYNKHFIFIISSFLQDSPKTVGLLTASRFTDDKTETVLSYTRTVVYFWYVSSVFGRGHWGSGAQQLAKSPSYTESSCVIVCPWFEGPRTQTVSTADSASGAQGRGVTSIDTSRRAESPRRVLTGR